MPKWNFGKKRVRQQWFPPNQLCGSPLIIIMFTLKYGESRNTNTNAPAIKMINNTGF